MGRNKNLKPTILMRLKVKTKTVTKINEAERKN